MSFFGWLFGRDEMGDDSRDYVAKNCKEGVDPRTAITDYGDEEGDEPESRDLPAAKRDSSGVGFSTRDEVEDFYNLNRATDIKITGGDKKR